MCLRNNKTKAHPAHFVPIAYRLPPSFLSTATQFPIDYHPVSYRLPPSFLSTTTKFPISYHSVFYRLPPSFLSTTTQFPIDYHPVFYPLPPSFLSTTTQFSIDYHPVSYRVLSSFTIKLGTCQLHNPIYLVGQTTITSRRKSQIVVCGSTPFPPEVSFILVALKTFLWK